MTTAAAPRPGIGRDRRGVAVIELALILPVLLLLSFGTIEAGLMLMTDASLEIAVRVATRYGITGAGGATRDANIATKVGEVMDRWKGSRGTLTVATKAYPSFDNIGKPEPFTDANGNKVYDAGEDYQDVNKNGKWDADMAASGAGGSGDVVLYTVTLTRPGFSGVLALVGIDTLTFSRQAAVENE